MLPSLKMGFHPYLGGWREERREGERMQEEFN